MQNKARKNYIIYVLMLLLFGGLIYVAIEEGDRFSHHAANTLNTVQDGPCFYNLCKIICIIR